MQWLIDQCYGDISFHLENLESTQLLSVKKNMTSACHRVGRVKKIYIDNSTKYKVFDLGFIILEFNYL